jgi:thiol-disulfide isomerase/thioredoxin
MMIRRRLALQIPLAATAGTLAATLRPRKPSAATLPSLAHGLERLNPPAAPPDVTFLAQDGTVHHLSEFKGRGMVVNMWATWCVPCVAEMPSLEALSKALAPQDIAVLPLSSDRGGAEKVASWYQEHGITGLPVLMDPKGALARAFEARGLPTTVIINTTGLVVARLEGAADWASPEAQTMIKRLTAG